MNALVLRLCVSATAGWVNRGQPQLIESLVEENRVLREQLGGRHLQLTGGQRRRLAVRATALGRRALMGVACIVTPDTRSALVQESGRPEVRRKRPPGTKTATDTECARPTRGQAGAVPSGLGLHQGPGNESVTPLPASTNADGSIQCREQLGGTLNFYYREAA